MSDSNASETPVDFQAFDEDALADETESGDFFYDTVISWLVECNGVLGLVLDFSFGPLLFLG